MSVSSLKRKIITWIAIGAATAIFVAVLFVLLYINGAFISSKIDWKEQDMTIDTDEGVSFSFAVSKRKVTAEIRMVNETMNVEKWSLDKKNKVQDAILMDIDRDGQEELLVLCWKMGKYGKSRPFFVKSDPPIWSQHLYIYKLSKNGVKPMWMASDVGETIVEFKDGGKSKLITMVESGDSHIWLWSGWGLFLAE